MLIQELAKQTGLTATTIRYYESIGLIPPPQRAENNYREYTAADVERVRFIAGARSLDFSLNDIAEFLAARDDGSLLSAGARTCWISTWLKLTGALLTCWPFGRRLIASAKG